jgi:GNAT superfamily N-acetyltransferase
MTLTFVLDPAPGPELYEDVLSLWTDVTNAGGAVGFVAPVVPDDIRPQLDKQFAEVARGRSTLLVGLGPDGRAAAAAFLTRNTHRLQLHWVWAYTVMVHPRLQGRGHGRELMAALADAARSLGGIEAVRLGVRGGMGLEQFYASCGYKEVGRVPDAVRVAPGDDRDDITMLLPLH